MDWVERRSAQEAAIASTLERIWAHLEVAITHAVASYNAHYKSEGIAYVHVRYSDTIAASREDRMTRTTVALLRITRKFRTIEVTYDKPIHTPVIFAAVNDGGAVVIQHDGATVDVERMSELALTPILFSELP